MAAHPPPPRPRSPDRAAPDSAAGPRRGGTARRGRAPLVVAATVNTLWALLVSYLPVAAVTWLVRLAEGESSLPGAARIGLAAWLLGHGVPLQTPTGPLGLVPLMLSALAAWRIYRAGVYTTRAIGARRTGSPGQVAAVAVAVGVAYGLVGAAAAVGTDTVATAGDPLRAALGLAGFGAVGRRRGTADPGRRSRRRRAFGSD